ncbi:hypothetical protein FRC12_008414 [Ceratobasidium sp. 428]|nr:hypothetical protein FRC12_008414 [Ceratobasidium sp. 428]
MNLWLDSGKPNLAEHLLVYRPYASVLLSPEFSSRNLRLLSRSDNARGAVNSLKRLHLQNIKFDWDSGAYRGLVDLRLHCFCSSTSISIAQLVNILSSNPALITLKLSCLKITSSSDWSPTPVTLSCLQVLTLFYIDPKGLQFLLPLLILPGSSVKVGIGPTDLDSISSELERFFGRNSHVIALKLRQWKRSAFLTWLPFLTVLPRLDNLVLDSFHMDVGSDVGVGVDNPLLSVSPRLPSILFSKCTITLEGLKMLVVEHGTSLLRLESCVVSDGSGINMEDIQTSLLGAYPELQIVISNTSSAEHLEYCRMFNWTN